MSEEERDQTQNSETTPEVGAEEDLAQLKQTLAEETEKAQSYLANWQRAQADFINYKRRTEQEKEELGKFANANLILSLLPILDDFERAFSVIPEEQAKLDWVEGIKLVARKLRSSLEAQGLTQIKAVSEPFDPNFHEAVKQDKGKEGIVIHELHKGYLLNGKLLRPAAVIVGSGEEAEKEDK